MLGRSDGVLNPGGIRFGPTDIYSVLETLTFAKEGVEDTLVVGLMCDGGADEKVVLFVKVSFLLTVLVVGQCGLVFGLRACELTDGWPRRCGKARN